MIIVEDNILNIISLNDIKFTIYPYQRYYEWDEALVEQLYNDIKILIDNKEETHYLGEVTIKKHSDPHKITEIVEVIDSQQRLISIFLYMKALVEYDKETNGKYSSLSERIYSNILFNSCEDEETAENKIKLKLKKNDFEIYKELILNQKVSNNSSLIFKHYEYFLNRMKEDSINITDVYNSLKRLTIIKTLLEEKDNAQVRFNRINSSRKGFNNWDFIRFNILFGLEENYQEYIEENYIIKLEKYFNYDYKKITEFVRDYLIIKEKKAVNNNSMVKIFEDFFIKGNIRIIENQLLEMLEYAKLYHYILTGIHDDTDIQKYLEDFKMIDIRPTRFLLLKFLADYENRKLNKDELIESLKIILSYIVRRFMADYNSNQLNSIFISLINSIKERNYFYSIKLYLLRCSNQGQFVNDIDFEQNFLFNMSYNRSPKITKYILCELENNSQNEQLKIIDKITIEHIMPKNVENSIEWKNELGEDWDKIHEKYINVLGNLTLTGNNSKLGNKSFAIKKNMKNGFKESNIRISKGLCVLEKWGKDEIISRGRELFLKAIEVWKYPEVNFEKRKIEYLTIYDNWTSADIIEVVFGKERLVVKTKTDIYKFIITKIYELNKQEFMNMVNLKMIPAKDFASYNTEDLYEQCFELGQSGIYIGTKLNNERKKTFIKNVVNILNVKEEIRFVEANI